MKQTYLAVAGRIRRELEEIGEVVDRTTSIWSRAEASGDDYYIDGVALNLHGFYAGIERLFEVIANRIDETVPSGANWHQELLEQMASEIPNVRPAVLTSATRRTIDRYRGFRHVVRNVYTLDFDPKQIQLLVEGLPDAMEQLERDLHVFADVLERVAQDE